MRILIYLVSLLLVACVSGGATNHNKKSERILFVGNSLIYVGNVPAVYAALATANGHPVISDMIVRGGATLSQRVADGSVANALTAKTYTTLVLQERGGDLMGSFHPDARIKSQEATAAAEAGIPYIEVSEKLRHLRSVAPEMAWFAPDGMHPGKDLALLNAVLVYQTLQGALPKPEPLAVTAPIYASKSGLTEALRQADAPPPLASTPAEAHYPTGTLTILLNEISGVAGR